MLTSKRYTFELIETLCQLLLTKGTRLDVERFASDFDRGSQAKAVLADYEDVLGKYEGWEVPLVIIGDHYPIVGAITIAMYRRLVDLCPASADS